MIGPLYRMLAPQSGKWLSIVIVMLLSVTALTVLFMRSESVSSQAHYNYIKVLRDLGESDAESDGEVLANRLEITRNYDALTLYLKQVQQAASGIDILPDFLSDDDRKRVLETAHFLQEAITKKSRLVELFKRQNAVLRNSMAYFSSSAEYFLDAGVPSSLKSPAENYVRHILYFARNPDDTSRSEVDEMRRKLVAVPLSGSARAQVESLLLHGDAIVNYQPQVDVLTREIRNLKTASRLDEIGRQYALAHEHAQQQARRYRALLFILALALTGYLAFIFIHLGRARRSLLKAHHELTQSYAEQLQTEDKLRLHATAFHNSHDGVVLSDASGNVLDVNPAFTRITGYDRAEVIGRNPRVIKSGRHEPAFYAAMWKSILTAGSWQGEIWNRNKYGEIYPELLSIAAVRDAAGKLTNFVGVFSDISRIKEQEKQLKQMAYYDPLTELPNRVLLADRLVQGMHQSKRSGNMLAICYLDLDGFKAVNDTYGHEVGDRVLVEMAERFRGNLRGGDTVARLGGDEFVLLLSGLEDMFECEDAVQRWLALIAKPLSVVPETISLSASIGVTTYPADDGDPDTLLRHADQAMYQAKQGGKNRYHLFDHEQDVHVRTQHDRIARIEQALVNGEFLLYYQPKVDMRKGAVIGMEALIRWNHPERGLVRPMDFLPLIEEHDLIVRVGEWVIATALHQMNEWHEMGLELSVSVNVAGRQLQDAGFMQYLTSTLGNYPNVARQLELEILETSALEDMNKVSRVIEQCSEIGISCSLDDFGTGYSSLTYLKRLPAETIKIDQSFVREMTNDPNNLVIVQGVIGLTSAFQRQAIAEGVESVEHGRLLMQLGCDLAQGYGIARPMPATEVLSWVANWRPAGEWSAIKKLHWDASDRPMLVAKVEHRNWVAQLVHAVREGLPVSGKNLVDHSCCNFGQWYYGRGLSLYRHLPDFVMLEEPHMRVHEIAIEIDDYLRNGRPESAKGMLGELLNRRDQVCVALDRLELEVAQSRGERES